MDETGVNHAIRRGGAAAQALQVFQITSMDRGACRGEGRCPRIRAGKTKHLMACADQLLNNGRTDKAGGAGDEHTHDKFSFASLHGRERTRGLVMSKGRLLTRCNLYWKVRIIFAIIRCAACHLLNMFQADRIERDDRIVRQQKLGHGEILLQMRDGRGAGDQ